MAMQMDPEEVQHYTRLRTELDGYWETLAPVFQWSAAQRGRLGFPFLRDEVFPRRQNMLDMADRIAEINEQQLTAGNAQVAALLSGFQTRLAMTLIAALGLGLGMAAFSIHQILKLEAREQARFEEVAGARAQLKDLIGASWCTRRKPSGVRFPANCTMRSGNRFRRC